MTASNSESSSAGSSLNKNSLPQLDGYELLGVEDVACQGTLYSARDTAGRSVTIYWMDQLAKSGRDVTLFARDAATLAKLSNAHLGTILATGCHKGVPFQVLPPSMGTHLQDRLTGWPRPCLEAVEWMRQIVVAVREAHVKGISHGDLTPKVIEITAAGELLVTRFSLAPGNTQRVSELPPRSAAYVAPEQFSTTAAEDLTCDVYALGVIFYEMLIGQPPHVAGTTAAISRLSNRGGILPPHRTLPELPKKLSAIVYRCLQTDPARRYESAMGLADDIRRFLNGEAVSAKCPGLLSRAVQRVKRHPIRTLVPAALLIGISMNAEWAWRSFDNAAEQNAALRNKNRVNEALLDQTRTNLKAALMAMYRTTQWLARPEFDQYAAMNPLRRRVFAEIRQFQDALQERNGGMEAEDLFVGYSRLQTAALFHATPDSSSAEEHYHNSMRILQFKRRVITANNEPGDDPGVMEIIALANRGEGLLLMDSIRATESIPCFDAAIYGYEKVVEAGKGSAHVDFAVVQIHMERAEALRKQKKHSEALADLVKARELFKKLEAQALDPFDVAYLSLLIWQQQGLVELALDDGQAAVASITNAITELSELRKNYPNDLDLRPLSASLVRQLGDSQLAQGKTEEGQQTLKAANDQLSNLLSEFPRFWRLHHERAEILSKLGDTAGEADARRLAAELKPVDLNPIRMPDGANRVSGP